MLRSKHRAILAAALTVLVIGLATSSLATSWDVQPFVSTPANEYFAAWSPDGQQMAYVSDATGMRQVYIVNADGTGTWQVTNDSNGVYDVAWSPDSQYLVYSQIWSYPHDLIKVELNATRDGVVALTNLTNETQTASWRDARFSPNGQTIVAHRRYSTSWHIYLVQPDGSGAVRVSNTYSLAPAWKPNGSLAAYGLSSSTTGISDIWTVGADGSGNAELVDSSATNQHIRALAWSPDGSKIVYADAYEPTSFLGLVNGDGTGAVVLDATTAACAHQLRVGQEDVWSADGSTLVYSCLEEGVWNVYTINADGTNKEPVASSAGNDMRARFCGGGNVCFETDRDGNWDIYVATSNRPPVADANGPYIVPAASWDGALVELNGAASSDPDGDPLLYSWKIGGEEIGTDPIITYQFPIGLTEGVTLTVTDPNGASSTAETMVTVTVFQVEVDIRPFTEFNFINLNSNGVLPVAFLTDEMFDAATIDPVTITMAGQDFGGLIKMRGRRNPQPAAWLLDVDQDGDDDLLVFLEIENLTLEPTDAVCVLGALTYDGWVVQGQDNVVVWPNR